MNDKNKNFNIKRVIALVICILVFVIGVIIFFSFRKESDKFTLIGMKN